MYDDLYIVEYCLAGDAWLPSGKTHTSAKDATKEMARWRKRAQRYDGSGLRLRVARFTRSEIVVSG